ncbi:MAG: hypothetical protein DDT39_01536 [Firmicutes bacterium]|nr:hypothetical protein [candidate division NPL-UPA2 bacterium]
MDADTISHAVPDKEPAAPHPVRQRVPADAVHNHSTAVHGVGNDILAMPMNYYRGTTHAESQVFPRDALHFQQQVVFCKPGSDIALPSYVFYYYMSFAPGQAGMHHFIQLPIINAFCFNDGSHNCPTLRRA